MGIPKLAAALLLICWPVLAAAKGAPDPARDILVTFDNNSAATVSAGLAAPYKHRKRYAIARQVRRDAIAIAKEFSLTEIEHWPIRSLSVYCFVYRVPEGADRKSIIEALNSDVRVESAQSLQSFETSVTRTESYDDTYAGLQYGLDLLDIASAHQTTRGAGIRVAIIDSNVDRSHEDLSGRIERIRKFVNKGQSEDRYHGTAIASVIGARSNNALGIVGIAPEASLELYVSCWSGGVESSAICDTFSLSKALDAIIEDPPHVLNLSLTGPYDPLLERLIERVAAAGVVIVASGYPALDQRKGFPSTMDCVIGVDVSPTDGSIENSFGNAIFAPGNRILVAMPKDQYEFRSGRSLAAAHVSGVAALLLSVAPDHSPETISSILRRSQAHEIGLALSVNACDALNLTGSARRCVRKLAGSLRKEFEFLGPVGVSPAPAY